MRLRALAPAKINLGLEILGKRPDGYHEIRTVLAAISLFDRLTLTSDGSARFHVDDPELAGEPNLVERVMVQVQTRFPTASASIRLEKRIPAASGLGGASSDAAVALMLLNRGGALGLSQSERHAIAAGLGSDVPFFLEGGRALASGRGELLTPLPPLTGLWVIVVAPFFRIPAKTATLYRSLRSTDFSDGKRVVASIESAVAPKEDQLANAFSRALYEIAPELERIPAIMRACGAATVALSGAGPAHYALEADLDRARSIVSALRDTPNLQAGVYLTRFVGPEPLITVDTLASEAL